MKLSLVFELLLIFILLAFAASKSVKKNKHNHKKHIQRNDNNVGDKIEDNNINKYCKCVEAYCNCCREFRLPVVQLNGPGCATLKYLNGDKMSISLNFGKKVITNRTVSSRKPSPICMPLPGGISKFCGRVYNIARTGEEFRACLGLELRSKNTVEAAVRVSCFKFGPRGVTSEPADPLPLVPQDEKNDDDDDDDDYDDFGLGGDEDDDDDNDDDDDDDGDLDAVNAVDSSDYGGFSLLGEDLLSDLFGSTSEKKPKKNIKKQAPVPTKITTTKRPRPSRRPSRRPNTRSTTPRTTRSTTTKTRPPKTRRPTRRPSRRPTRKPTTEITSTPILTTTLNTQQPVPSSPLHNSPSLNSIQVSAAAETTEHMQTVHTISGHTSVPISPATENAIVSVIPVTTTTKSVANFEDPGLEMSLATITGQLSAMQVTPLFSNNGKETMNINRDEEAPKYEKIETITRKNTQTAALPPSYFPEVYSINDYETTENEPNFGGESRKHLQQISNNHYEGFIVPKKPKEKQFHLDDLDVLDLGKIGESLGEELGIFGTNKKKRNNKDTKVNNEKDNDYDDLVDAVGDTLMVRRSDKVNKKDRRRQNKMMREWTIQPMTE